MTQDAMKACDAISSAVGYFIPYGDKVQEIEACLATIRRALSAVPPVEPAKRKVGTIAHIDSGKTALTAAIVKMLSEPSQSPAAVPPGREEALPVLWIPTDVLDKVLKTPHSNAVVRNTDESEKLGPHTALYLAAPVPPLEPVGWISRESATRSGGAWSRIKFEEDDVPISFSPPQQESEGGPL